ncbi:MAG: metallophosphoesterase [Gordonia sp. (in: high G+C Gram-positive bacteria)]
MFVVAHISDLHFNGSRINRGRAESTLSYLNARAAGINALLVTGDIADSGTAAQYAEAAQILRTDIPMLLTGGNHDVRENLRAALLDAGQDEPVNSSRVVDDVLFVVADSSIPGSSAGYLTDETVAWMADEISAVGPEMPVFVAFHHPPADVQMPYMDTIRQTGEQRVAAFVERFPNIVGFFCGHVHSGCVTNFAGRPLITAPGVVSTLNLPFEGRDILNRGQPPGIAFHILDDRRLVTHFRSVMF